MRIEINGLDFNRPVAWSRQRRVCLLPFRVLRGCFRAGVECGYMLMGMGGGRRLAEVSLCLGTMSFSERVFWHGMLPASRGVVNQGPSPDRSERGCNGRCILYLGVILVAGYARSKRAL